MGKVWRALDPVIYIYIYYINTVAYIYIYIYTMFNVFLSCYMIYYIISCNAILYGRSIQKLSNFG